MREALSPTTVLLLIDVQQGFDDAVWGKRNNPDAERQMARLLQQWRTTQRPVIHVQHDSIRSTSPLHPDQSGNTIKSLVQPRAGELHLHKSVNSCFIGTDLEQQLRQRDWTDIVLVGLTTPHCVSTTARMAGNLGFRTYVVADATAAFDLLSPDGIIIPAQTIHDVSLTTLHKEFATIIETEQLLDLAK